MTELDRAVRRWVQIGEERQDVWPGCSAEVEVPVTAEGAAAVIEDRAAVGVDENVGVLSAKPI